ncbi:MAG: nucleotidyltransferase domain-containing protein [Fimbriimonadales bacterium]
MELLQRVRKAIESVVGDEPMELYLYGSRARGDATPESDWDFLLILPDKKAKELENVVSSALYRLSLDTDELLYCIVMGRSEWEFLKLAQTPFAVNVQREAVRL